MKEEQTFLKRFHAYTLKQGRCLLPWPISAKQLEIKPETIYWESQRNDDLKVVRALIIRFTSDDVSEILRGSGQAYVMCNNDFMAPYTYEKIDIDIPTDAVDLLHIWALYENWFIEWTPVSELQELVGKTFC